MTNFKKGALALAMIAGMAGPAGARPRAHNETRRMPIERLAQRLELTTDQVSALKRIDHERVARSAELQARVEVLRYEIEGLMAAETPDKGAVFAKIDAVHSVRADISKAQFAARIEMKAVLGDKADEVARLMERRKGRKGREGQKARRHARKARSDDQDMADGERY